MMRVRNNRKKGGQAGFVQTAELLLITTVLGIGLVTGFTKLRDQTLAELSDTGDAIGSIDQSYKIATTNWFDATTGQIATKTGFQFADAVDTAGLEAGGNVGGDAQTIKYAAAPASAAE